jgi:hypothetical protein
MAHVLRDILTGSTIVVLGMLLSLVASIALLIIWVFFHIVGPLAVIFFFIFLFFVALWLIGFGYRKLKETGTE